ncbi:TetR/AcrR family transcriptional regulator [Agrococcus sp. SGAir0287]|uniref:TetR/AcrR family transcriptional regulator n=1 Tax=Agrococcus sp. SGAir0287 TaxID=2070347 RepID=UPI0010CCE0D9|nr:TetR/AcrR family transcriptional regulator [Agrococcus sp. SGAir0287]QCR20258.1 TetR family transcriptional regulator [Agrococcus sp. SGAir0287]
MAAGTAEPTGRRERNKQEKLERITRAARELFDARGVDGVTTQEVADRADVGTGTLFLYAPTKGDLLLLAQNAAYAEALERGIARADVATEALDGVMAIIGEVVHCNRAHVANGRTYLRELLFGDPTTPHRIEALASTARTERAIAETIARTTGVDATAAATLARLANAAMLLALTSPLAADASEDELLALLRAQVTVLLP